MTIEEIKQLKKRELHCHLNGALSYDTINRLILENGVKVPNGFNYPEDLFIKHRVKSMQEYFTPWQVLKLLSIGKTSLQVMFDDVLNNFYKRNIDYTELRFSPKNILDNNDVKLDEALNWLIEAVQSAEKKNNVRCKLILSLNRENFSIEFAEELFRSLRTVNKDKYIIGVDLTGDEMFVLPNGANEFYLKCKYDLGLGVSIHAGETGNDRNVLDALRNFHADRIGHGIALINNNSIVELVLKKGTSIELCLQSNYLTSNVAIIEDHPVVKFIEYNIPFVICTDNPAIHNFDLNQEYELFYRITKRDDILREMYKIQTRYSFS